MANVKAMENIRDVMDDPCTSDWLKEALRKALDRDSLKATRDAELLAKLLKDRMELQYHLIRSSPADS